ncbi:hypothetical protein C8J57DRAFT_1705220 [Mycena rebaudengoi]|nr:hypothetical protein C8J57DRAFT_1705220 [Mycena rebaudengoi]
MQHREKSQVAQSLASSAPSSTRAVSPGTTYTPECAPALRIPALHMYYAPTLVPLELVCVSTARPSSILSVRHPHLTSAIPPELAPSMSRSSSTFATVTASLSSSTSSTSSLSPSAAQALLHFPKTRRRPRSVEVGPSTALCAVSSISFTRQIPRRPRRRPRAHLRAARDALLGHLPGGGDICLDKNGVARLSTAGPVHYLLHLHPPHGIHNDHRAHMKTLARPVAPRGARRAAAAPFVRRAAGSTCAVTTGSPQYFRPRAEAYGHNAHRANQKTHPRPRAMRDALPQRQPPGSVPGYLLSWVGSVPVVTLPAVRDALPGICAEGVGGEWASAAVDCGLLLPASNPTTFTISTAPSENMRTSCSSARCATHCRVSAQRGWDENGLAPPSTVGSAQDVHVYPRAEPHDIHDGVLARTSAPCATRREGICGRGGVGTTERSSVPVRYRLVPPPRPRTRVPHHYRGMCLEAV